MRARVHSNRVARTRLDAVAAEDAPKLVDHEFHGVTLVTSSLVPLGVLPGVDEDALRGARRGTAQARDAPRAPVVALSEPVHPAKAVRVRALLLGVADGADAFVEALGHGVGSLGAKHLSRVAEEVLHRHADAARDLG